MHRRFRSFLTASGTRAACLLAALACGAALRAGELASADLRPLFARWGLDARRQGKRGTCSVFVITGAIEFAKAKTRGSSERLSVEFLNWAANVTHGDQKDGGFFADLWNGFTAHGICPEEDMPYRDEFDPKREPGEFARDQGSQAHALGLGLRWIKAWNPRKGVNAAQLAEIKRTLLRGWPVAGGFLWPKDPQWDDGVLRMCPRPEVRDGHSVLLVGFVDDPVKPGGGTFIIRDSNRDDPDERLFPITRLFGGNVYLAGSRGRNHMARSKYLVAGVEVIFQEYRHPVYPQLWGDFEPFMSVVDLIYNRGLEALEIIRRGR